MLTQDWMPMALTLRQATADEAGVIWQITHTAYLPDRDRLHPPSGVFRETVEDVRRAMQEGVIHVAELDGAVVGAVRTRRHEHEEALYCGRLAVLTSARRRGIGRALMDCVERHGVESGYRAVVLGVRLELPENLRFYQRLGYQIIDEERHPGFDHPTFLWMRKELSP
jgi:predicted N-acetyltransferase YhbS